MKMYVYLISVSVIWICIFSTVDSCNFGSACTFPCHCEGGDSDCNEDGSCKSGNCAINLPPGYDWRGPRCQIGNVARNKRTDQNGVSSSRNSSLAVDGRRYEDYTGNSKNQQCTHTEGLPAWWYVNLGSLHVVQKVTVFNQHTASTRLSHFKVYVGNTSEVSLGSECGHYTYTVPQAGNDTIVCGTEIVGQFVGIQLERNEPLQLCEVVVEGYKYSACSNGKYGPGCLQDCNINCEDNFCNEVTGTCSKCKLGTYVPKCEVCKNGTYGLNCATHCGKCAKQSICDKVTGNCPNGCQKWYISDLCKDYVYETIIHGVLKSPSQTAYSISITWKQQKNVPEGGEVYYNYDLYRRKGTTVVKNLAHIKGQENQTAKVTGLLPDTNYEFWVRPYRQWGNERDGGADTLVSIFKTMNGSTAISTLKTNIEITTHANLETTGTTASSSSIPSTTTTVSTSITISKSMEPTMTPNTPELFETGKNKPMDITPIVAGVGGLILLIIMVVIIVVVIKRRKTSALTSGLAKNGKRISDTESNGMALYSDTNKTTIVLPSTSSQTTEVQYSNIDLKKKEPKNQDKEKMEEENMNSSQSVGALYAEVQKRPKKNKRLKVSELDEFIAAKLVEKDGFKNEYTSIPSGPTKSWNIGNVQQNKTKNRFLNIRAYDHSRVILEKDEGDEFSDYINASYITGYNNEANAFIATQGPKQKTIKEFWKMIWQVKANRIVMVTNLVEKTKVKCAAYWPETEGQTVKAGIFTIKSTSSEKLTNFTTSVLSIKKGNKTLLVRHFHFTAWPDHDVPDYATALLEFRRRIRSYDGETRGPLVIHCSAGVGRTGTFIAIDHAIDKAETEGEVDILGCTRAMREERINMIQTEIQYTFVYKAVLEATECGDTTIKSSRIEGTMKTLFTDDPAMKMTPIQHQFQVLQKYRPAIKSKNSVGLQPLNDSKNRDPEIIPANSSRPILGEPLPTVPGGMDYINATFVDGYEKADAYIMTQMPLPHTIPDLWRLMFDHKLKTIVMLNDMEQNDESCQSYWPDGDTPLQFGPLKVELVNTENDPSGNVTTRELNISKEGAESVTVKQFHLCTWETTRTVPESSSFLTIMDIVQSWQQQTKNRPTVIHCMNGSDRSGVYCVANYILEQLKINRDFNIYSAIKLMRVARPQIITSLEQYQFLHNFAVEYIQQNDAYANFKM